MAATRCRLAITTISLLLGSVSGFVPSGFQQRHCIGKPMQPALQHTSSNCHVKPHRHLTVFRGEKNEEAVGTEVPFELRGFSLATVALGLGALITVGSLAEYILTSGSEGLSGVGFVYGIPILLIGLSLKYAQLDPVPVKSTPEADRIFDQKATATIKKIKKDVTRHRYGDDAHLDTTVQALGLVMPNKEFPQLKSIKQSQDTPYRLWIEPERIAKYDRFFGPDVWATVEKVDAGSRLVAITLTTGQRPPEASPTPQSEEKEKESA